MSSLNEVKLIGRIGKVPEVAKTHDGKSIIKFSLATTERWTDKNANEKKEKTEWHRIVIYNTRLCEILESQKEELIGALAYVSGKLRYEKWTSQNGTEQKATSIVIDAFSGTYLTLQRKQKSFNDDQTQTKSQQNSSDDNFDFSSNFAEEESDEIPF